MARDWTEVNIAVSSQRKTEILAALRDVLDRLQDLGKPSYFFLYEPWAEICLRTVATQMEVASALEGFPWPWAFGSYQGVVEERAVFGPLASPAITLFLAGARFADGLLHLTAGDRNRLARKALHCLANQLGYDCEDEARLLRFCAEIAERLKEIPTQRNAAVSLMDHIDWEGMEITQEGAGVSEPTREILEPEGART